MLSAGPSSRAALHDPAQRSVGDDHVPDPVLALSISIASLRRFAATGEFRQRDDVEPDRPASLDLTPAAQGKDPIFKSVGDPPSFQVAILGLDSDAHKRLASAPNQMIVEILLEAAVAS